MIQGVNASEAQKLVYSKLIKSAWEIKGLRNIKREIVKVVSRLEARDALDQGRV